MHNTYMCAQFLPHPIYALLSRTMVVASKPKNIVPDGERRCYNPRSRHFGKIYPVFPMVTLKRLLNSDQRRELENSSFKNILPGNTMNFSGTPAKLTLEVCTEVSTRSRTNQLGKITYIKYYSSSPFSSIITRVA